MPLPACRLSFGLMAAPVTVIVDFGRVCANPLFILRMNLAHWSFFLFFCTFAPPFLLFFRCAYAYVCMRVVCLPAHACSRGDAFVYARPRGNHPFAICLQSVCVSRPRQRKESTGLPPWCALRPSLFPPSWSSYRRRIWRPFKGSRCCRCCIHLMIAARALA